MEPKFVEREAVVVMGTQERVTPQTADFEGIWKRYMARHDEIEKLSDAEGWYGVCFCAGNEDAIDYLAGMAVPEESACPDGLTMREIPAGQYAVFECTVATIPEAYEFIHHAWLPASEHTYDRPRPDFEHYAPGTDSGDSRVHIHIPVRRARADEGLPNTL